MAKERNLCANCDHWREEHYDGQGVFIGDVLFGCTEYEGSAPSKEREAKRDKELAKSPRNEVAE